MKTQLIQYRTYSQRNNNYAMIPDIYLPDFLNWLKLLELGDIVKVTDNTQSPYGFIAPKEWPNYRNCAEFIRTVELLEV